MAIDAAINSASTVDNVTDVIRSTLQYLSTAVNPCLWPSHTQMTELEVDSTDIDSKN